MSVSGVIASLATLATHIGLGHVQLARTALGAAATGRVFKVASPRVYRRQLAAQRAMVQHASEAARPSGALD
ncbi:uncharacterized protein LOC142566388 isoform X4 [Dermacentor variabilis]|uniref:uncharacterized protein LOC142566388 isoform X4 n=1 Tax=Dermacentor variabilis TaxID=34621 RepID=UPI003F5AE76E